MTKRAAGISSDGLERYERLVATQPGVERKGAATPYTSLNGHMSSFLSETGMLALRLPDVLSTKYLNQASAERDLHALVDHFVLDLESSSR